MSAFGVGVDGARTPRVRTGRERIGSGVWRSAGSCRAVAALAAPRRHVSARVLGVPQCPVHPRFPTAPATRSRTRDIRPVPGTHHRSSGTPRQRPVTARSNQAADDADTPRESATQGEDALVARFSSTGHSDSPVPPVDTSALARHPVLRMSSQDCLSVSTAGLIRCGHDYEVVLCSSLSSLPVTGHAGRVSRRSATLTTAVMPTSLTV